MKTLAFLFVIILFFWPNNLKAQIKEGMYTFRIAYAEWNGNSLGATCTVTIKGDAIQIINDGSLSGKKGELIEEGRLIQHTCGKWIIAKDENDKFAEEIGGCSDSPRVIDLEDNIIWLC